MKKKILISIGIIIFFAIGFSLYSFNQKLNQPVNAVSSISPDNNVTAVVEKRNIKSLIQTNGNVRAEETEEFQIEPGKKIKFFVKDGQSVDKGQILYQIIDKELELQYNQALRDKRTQSTVSVDTGVPVDSLGSGISQINNQIASLKEKLEANKVKATFDGIISILNISTGTPENNQMMVKLSNPNSLIVPVNFEEIDYPKIRIGQSATVKLTAYGNKIFIGQVARISKEAVTKDGAVTIPGVIRLNQNPIILPGMSSDVNILINSKDNVLSLPLESIQEDETGNSFVNVIKEGSKKVIEKRLIKIGIKDDKYIEILSGLKEGDMVQPN